MLKIFSLAAAAVLLLSAPVPADAARAEASVVQMHRCNTSRDYCIVIEYTQASPHRVPLVIAHKVSGRKGHSYWARWMYQKPGKDVKVSRWKKSSWTGENGDAPGVAVESLWGHTGRASGPKLPAKTLVCAQFKGSKKKACYRLP
ncbi:hypothetical protein OG782_00190 [Streptomyces sp. NBC_00876]|uniref:hypothetical protein n=1 Tax=Streptomyces sp. NBC_00876 TaxID=2975853 RepID=UPI00386FDE87|nr:hypothetical protein OG782_00190 [Streptomyces sp. NBC_00876]